MGSNVGTKRIQQSTVKPLDLPITLSMICSHEQVTHLQDAMNILEEFGREIFPFIREHLFRRAVEKDPLPHRSLNRRESGYSKTRGSSNKF